jgi:hypothetical protein
VHSSAEALALKHVTTLGGIKCRLLLPEDRPGLGPLGPPCDARREQDHDWPELSWGYVNTPDLGRSVTVRAIGLIPIDATVTTGDELLAFDRAVGRWRAG